MQIKLIHTQRVLSPTNITLAPYAINPYRGCEFGCIYCYGKLARNVKNNTDTLGVKINAAGILEKELRQKKVEKVILGSNCECFTRLELKYHITEQILNILNKNNVPFVILTKSPLIKGYLSLIGKNKNSKIFFTFNTSDEATKALLEEKSPPLKERLLALEAIKHAGVPLRVHIGPYIPSLCNLDELFSLVRGTTDELNIELYHSKMGSFKAVIEKIISFAPQKAKEIESIYKNKNNYYNFSQELKKRIKQLNKKYNFIIYFVIPEFDKFYDSKINYEQPLL